ncbi:hypothetical protein FB567DRAFT_540151 [Paraphoma chrysanthemicola]|uniref:Uncharacterized protein n=1 Tax=Paraphoma chrysanthemicola TaxID=798071 RepID=A0A8K0VSP8_9PLEO|nr:hypothetical protein FB567DRAFT_540151 [Paraphoma chrysanthemicola]
MVVGISAEEQQFIASPSRVGSRRDRQGSSSPLAIADARGHGLATPVHPSPWEAERTAADADRARRRCYWLGGGRYEQHASERAAKRLGSVRASRVAVAANLGPPHRSFPAGGVVGLARAVRGPLVRPGSWGGDEPRMREIRRPRRRRWEPFTLCCWSDSGQRPAAPWRPVCARLLACFPEHRATPGRTALAQRFLSAGMRYGRLALSRLVSCLSGNVQLRTHPADKPDAAPRCCTVFRHDAPGWCQAPALGAQ